MPNISLPVWSQCWGVERGVTVREKFKCYEQCPLACTCGHGHGRTVSGLIKSESEDVYNYVSMKRLSRGLGVKVFDVLVTS